MRAALIEVGVSRKPGFAVALLAVGGIVRGVNNSAVNKQIELFYTDATGEPALVIETSAALYGLHLVDGHK